jgi:putative DNA primase/helicase
MQEDVLLMSTANLVIPSLKSKASKWFKQGINVLATQKVTRDGKTNLVPFIAWAGWQSKFMEKIDFEDQPWSKADGYALILGKLKTGQYLSLFDFDDKQGLGLWKDSDFRDCDSYCEKTPHNGYHILMLSEKEPKNVKDYKELEFLNSGHITHVYDAPIRDLPLAVREDANITFDQLVEKFHLKPRDLLLEDIKKKPAEELLALGVEIGLRDDVAFVIACKLRFEEKNSLEAGLLLTDWNKLNDPPLSTTQLNDKIKSAYKNPNPYYQTLKKIVKNGACKVDVIERRNAVYLRLKKENHFACLPNQELYIYQDGVYISHEIPEQIVKLAVETEFDKDYSKNDYEQVLDRIKASSPVDEDHFDHVPLELVCFRNGILNLETRQLSEHSPSVPFLNKIDVKYDPEAKCPEYDKRILEWVASEQHTMAIDEFIGYCLWRKYTYEKSFFFIGEGENGKTTLLSLIVKFLGEKNVSHIPVQELSAPFKLVLLYGKLANIADELSTRALSDTAKYKEVTGRSPIKGDIKFKQYGIDFVSYAKMIFATNQLPATTDYSHAFFRRAEIFHFDNVFSEENGNRDEHLLEKLTTDEELSGLLNRALDGLKRLQTNRKFSIESKSEETQEQWSLDPVKDFAENIVAGVGIGVEEVPCSELFAEFNKFCTERGDQPINERSFGFKLRKHLSAKGIRFKRTLRQKDGKREYVYSGIVLRSTEETENVKAYKNDGTLKGWIDPQ